MKTARRYTATLYRMIEGVSFPECCETVTERTVNMTPNEAGIRAAMMLIAPDMVPDTEAETMRDVLRYAEETDFAAFSAAMVKPGDGTGAKYRLGFFES